MDNVPSVETIPPFFALATPMVKAFPTSIVATSVSVVMPFVISCPPEPKPRPTSRLFPVRSIVATLTMTVPLLCAIPV